jgi:SAM-dependent methyltransferase
MTYNRFAIVYDELMKEMPYDKWVQKVVDAAEKYQVPVRSILELACGTGELSVRLYESGFQVTGLDLSGDMLAVAHAKAAERGFSIPFIQQNMTDFFGFGQFDMAIIFCDSLNYLHTEEEVVKTFSCVYDHLKENGLFLFDVHSLYKINEIFLNGPFVLNEDNISYIWQCYEGEWPNSVEHDLSFFVRDDQSGLYERFDELHVQRTFSAREYEQMLAASGFEVLEVTADFTEQAPCEHSERIFFTAKAKKR